MASKMRLVIRTSSESASPMLTASYPSKHSGFETNRCGSTIRISSMRNAEALVLEPQRRSRPLQLDPPLPLLLALVVGTPPLLLPPPVLPPQPPGSRSQVSSRKLALKQPVRPPAASAAMTNPRTTAAQIHNSARARCDLGARLDPVSARKNARVERDQHGRHNRVLRPLAPDRPALAPPARC